MFYSPINTILCVAASFVYDEYRICIFWNNRNDIIFHSTCKYPQDSRNFKRQLITLSNSSNIKTPKMDTNGTRL